MLAAIELEHELGRLSALETRVLAVAAMLAPCSRTAVSEKVYRLRVSRDGGVPLSAPETDAILKTFVARAWFEVQSEGLHIEGKLRWRVLRWAVAGGHLELVLKAAEEFSVMGFRGLSDAHGALRSALLRGVPEQVQTALRRCRELGAAQYAFAHPLLEAVASDFDAPWFESLAPGVQTLACQAALDLGTEGCADLGEFWSYLIADEHTLKGVAPHARTACALWRGELDAAVPAVDPVAAACVKLFVYGDRQAAEQAWFPRTVTRAAAVELLPGLLGVVQILVAHTSESHVVASHVARLTQLLAKSEALSRHAVPLLKSLIAVAKSPQGAAQARHIGARMVYSELATPLLRALFALWHLDNSFELARTLADCRHFAVFCVERGFKLLAAQFVGVGIALSHKLRKNASRLDFGLAPGEVESAVAPALFSVADLLRHRSPWEASLDALAALTRKVAKETTQAIAEERLVWVIHVKERLIEPQVQRRGATGWTQGRSVPLRSLFVAGEQRSLVLAEDEPLLRLIRSESSAGAEEGPRLGINFEDALLALVEHPLVFIAPDRARPVELVSKQCSLRVLQLDEGYRLLAEPPGFDFQDRNARVQLCREGARWVVYSITPAQRDALAVVGSNLTVPLSGREYLQQILAQLATVLPIQTDIVAERSAGLADSRLVLRIVPLAESFNLSCFVRPFGHLGGPSFGPGEGERQISTVIAGEPATVVRDLATERATLDALLTTCDDLSECSQGDFTWSIPDAQQMLDLLSRVANLGERLVLEWPRGEGLRVHRASMGSSFRGSVAFEPGWYLVSGKLQLGSGAALELSALLDHLQRAPGRFVPVASGEFVELDAQLERQLRLILAARTGEVGGQALRIPSCALATLDALSQPNTLFTLSEPAAAWRESLQQVLETSYPQPAKFVGQLREYQQAAHEWLCRLGALGFGACLADDMGLGKTPTVLALLLTRAHSGPALVIAPTSVCTNWKREAARFAPSLHVTEYADSRHLMDAEKEQAVVVVSYGLLLRDLAAFRAVSWGTVVLDEAQFVKNANAQRAKAVLTLRAAARVAVTGTPVENRTTDLYGLFRFLNPGLLGDARQFEARFGELGQAPESVQVRIADLRLLLSPFIMRRTKEEVMNDLPPLTVMDEEIPFTDRERALYDALREEALRQVLGSQSETDSPSSVKILAQITRLRRFCCDPRLTYPEFGMTGSKLEAALSRIEALRQNGHRVLVFSQFVAMLTLVREELERRGFAFAYLDGSTERRARQRQVDEFQAGKFDVFLISLKAGGLGLNLTAADYVIHLDPWWNPAVEAQATDRAHRRGQEKPVTVYRFVMSGSVETRILSLHERKKDVAEQLLSSRDMRATWSADELLALLATAPAPPGY